VVVGYESDQIGTPHAMLWDGGVGERLDHFERGFSSAVGINDRGQIVGTTITTDGIEHGVIWDHGFARDLNDGIVRSDNGWQLSRATAINNKGQIVGDGTFGGEPRAFMLTPSTPNP
jgi:probable HAF family extracellular repeat protein